MDRRAFLSLAGVSFAGVAGCLGDGGGSTPTPTATIRGPRTGQELPDDGTPADGYPPAFETTPRSRSFDVGSFDTVSRNGAEVPLAPIEAAYYWYARGEARFADARGPGQFASSRVYGAVSSPASGVEDDPVDDWPTEDRVICYCGCPHHLSSIRAADLIDAGYENVAVIDEGFWEWTDRDYPIAGSDVESRPGIRVIEGSVAGRFAGETAWARHAPTEQTEATEIDADGRYVLELRFAGLGSGAEITVETPAYRVTAPIEELTAGVVTT
jgi:rhodanese-related sulfurtransferase